MPPGSRHQFNPSACQADFTYTTSPDAVKIQETGKGKRAVADDLEAAGDHPDDFLADVVLHNRGAVLDSIMEDRLLAETGSWLKR